MSSYVCGGSSFHPYECSHNKFCIHCTWGETEYHKPKDCALCQDLGFKLVDEKYHQPIRVHDLSHRKIRVLVKTLANSPNPAQEEIPF